MARIIGITGGIASGKSTVIEFLRQQGYQVIDADQVVHELQEPGGRLYQALLLDDMSRKTGRAFFVIINGIKS